MVTVEQLRQVRPDRVAALGQQLASRAQQVSALVAATAESTGRDLAGWHGPKAAASTAHRHALADDAGRLRDAHAEAARAVSGLADQLDQARQLLELADAFAALVGCTLSGRAEVSALPPAKLGPLAPVYDSVRHAAASLAGQALVMAETADNQVTRTLGGSALTSGTERLAVAAAPPLDDRYRASRARIETARGELRRARTEQAADRDSVGGRRVLEAINQRIGTLNSFLATRPVTAIDPATGRATTAVAERRFLGFDPSGTGRVAEVIGDLAAARVALLVPGARNGLDTLNALATDARLLADAAGPDVAAVVWVGYERPDRQAASALRRFGADLAPLLAPDAHVTLIGHGVGTVVAAAALRGGYRPDDVILVGSPGLGQRVRCADDLRPASPSPDGPPGPRLWTMRAPGDTIAYSREYGPDPAEFPEIRRLETQGGIEVTGHTRYYAVGSESLDNLARVVTGRLTEVTTTTIGLDEELMLAGETP